MNNEKKETTTFGKILRGIGLAILIAGTGLAIYDHRKQIGSTCRSISKKIFKNPVNSGNTNTGNNNPRRINNNIRKS